MATYSIQENKDGSVTVFNDIGEWKGVFRSYSHAAKFVRLVLEGKIAE